jgi:hypothetical protein
LIAATADDRDDATNNNRPGNVSDVLIISRLQVFLILTPLGLGLLAAELWFFA